MSNTDQFRREYSDANSGSYAKLADEYASLWSEHNIDERHFTNVRAGMIRLYTNWQKNLLPDPAGGALVICGPGQKIHERDLDPAIIHSSVSLHPIVIGADWSTKVLDDFYDSLVTKSECRKLGPKTVLLQRDMSGGLSAKLHHLITSQMEENIRNADDMKRFIGWIEDEVDLAKVQNYQHSNQSDNGEHRRGVEKVSDVSPVSFDSVTKGQCEVRLITANMFLAGMFALTEAEVRQQILSHEKDVGTEAITDMLRSWHSLIEVLNTHVALEFVRQGLEQNPHARIYAPTDVNVNYENYGSFSRVDVKAIEEGVKVMGHRYKIEGQWPYDDSGENPSHNHIINAMVFETNGKHTSDDVESGQRISGVAPLASLPGSSLNSERQAS